MGYKSRIMVGQQSAYSFDQLLTAEGWRKEAALIIDADGRIEDIRHAQAGDEHVGGIALPGMANAHSHAFQWAIAGRAESEGKEGDDFWDWRRLMYRAVEKLNPQDLSHIARAVYLRMLEAGYTSVAEFHYLHRDPAGARYGDPAEMAIALATAAKEAGIALTLLPALYTRGGFDDRPLEGPQRRFFLDPDDFVVVAESVAVRADIKTRLGIAIHSLRAVPPTMLNSIGDLQRQVGGAAPVHMHIAEQPREVEECRAALGTTPVRWLMGEIGLDDCWHLVHATHAEEEELKELARSAGSVVLCPTTEANLADGIFDIATYLKAGGRFSIGSDSQVELDPFAELRLLEYGRRLSSGRRGGPVSVSGASLGEQLWVNSAASGAGALGRPAGTVAPGRSADIVVIRPDDPRFAEARSDSLLNGLIFARWKATVDRVMVGGRWLVEDGRHIRRDALETGLDDTMRRIIADA